MDDEVPAVCRQCGGKCCQYFCFQIDAPDSFEEFDDLRWFLLHEGITIHVDEGDWYISIANRCKALGEHGRCEIYENRPLICRKYSTENCDFTGGDYGYEEFFQSPEDIEKYAMKVLGKKAYRQARREAYAKADRKEARRKAKAAKKGAGRKKRPRSGRARDAG
ncbi:MAG: YkgJ family cysteine cluster protein [Planctomycetes bacterium]|nr:YkgJ family cysteine cluster protein [Planctomycetota bacterium]